MLQYLREPRSYSKVRAQTSNRVPSQSNQEFEIERCVPVQHDISMQEEAVSPQCVQAFIGCESQVEVSSDAVGGGDVTRAVWIGEGNDRGSNYFLQIGPAPRYLVPHLRFFERRQIWVVPAVGSKFDSFPRPVLNLVGR